MFMEATHMKINFTPAMHLFCMTSSSINTGRANMITYRIEQYLRATERIEAASLVMGVAR
jgi:hypothetical protein